LGGFEGVALGRLAATGLVVVAGVDTLEAVLAPDVPTIGVVARTGGPSKLFIKELKSSPQFISVEDGVDSPVVGARAVPWAVRVSPVSSA